MKTLLLFLIVSLMFVENFAYEKKTIVERYTNYQCGPCANLNNSWYNQTTSGYVNSRTISHIVYNVNWPGAADPMYLLNSVDNAARWGYYGVNAVPWITVNGTTISTTQSAYTTAINNGNAEYSPFKIVLTPERFVNNVFNINVKIYRDSTDNTNFSKTMLRVGIVERTVIGPPGSLESFYYDITRRLLPDAKGTAIEIPAPGDFVEYDLMYIATQQFLQAVNLDSLSVVAFIQSDATKQIYQSAMEEIVLSNNINAAFTSSETLGASPLEINFQSYSSPSSGNQIVSWKWDFDNDGTIDTQEENPTWTFNQLQSYTVSLTVFDGVNEHTRKVKDLIKVINNTADILVVNGIHYITYPAEMQNFYNNSVPYGDNEVDIWDLFGDQEFNYAANSQVKQIHLYNRTVPTSVMKLYKKVIWIGNNYSGDLNFWNPDQVLDYVQNYGNFILATRWANAFLTGNLKSYCGINTVSGDQTITTLYSLDDSLVNVNSTGTNSFVHYVTLDASSEAIPIFDESLTPTDWIAGFRINKRNEGVFIFIAGRPYRYDNAASYANYDFMIRNWLTASPPVSVDDNINVVTEYSLSQNYPNPFNPSTKINFALPTSGHVTVKVYNLIGQEVASLINGNLNAGYHSVNFNGESLSSGIYFYTIKTNDYVETKKMILMK